MRTRGAGGRAPRPESSFPGPVLGPGLLAIRDALRIEHAADDMVAHAGEIAHAAAADQNDRMFLQVMAFARNVGGDFLAICQADACDFAQLCCIGQPRRLSQMALAPS